MSTTAGSSTIHPFPKSGKLRVAVCEGHRSAGSEFQKESHRVVSRGTRSADSIQVNGFINDQPQMLIVDSGSNCTLLRADVVDKSDLSMVKEGLCDVTGRRSPLRGPTVVELEIGGQRFQQELYVADELEEPWILGLDYLIAN